MAPAFRNFDLPGRSVAYARGGMAATSSPLATLTALDVLRAGGNAADAAVAAAAVLCLTEPAMTGIGGDCFVLIGLPDGTVKGLNGSGRASLSADAAWLKRTALHEIGAYGIHAITVPGAIDAWATLLKHHGALSFAEALAPAIRLAGSGITVQPRVAFDWAGKVQLLSQDEGAQAHYLSHGGAPVAGSLMRFPALAQTLKLIAAGGADAFYRGEIARDIVNYLRPLGSLLSLDDFARHRSDWVAPVSTRFHGAEILEIPPSGQGLTALIALNVLSRFDLAAAGCGTLRACHLQIEAMKLAWVLRNRFIADPDFASVPVAELLADPMADRLAALIRPDLALDDPASRVPVPGSDTVYLTVVDRNRMAVSLINSLYMGFGSGRVTPKTGITLQNRGAGFVTDPRHPNCIGPGKRPLHTIIPAMARVNGKVALSFGVMGGAYQPMGHVSVALDRFVHGMDLQQAIDAPRFFPEAGLVQVESGVPAAICSGLEAMGHKLAPTAKPLGGAQAIAIDWQGGGLEGGSDPRKDGMALGYD